MKMTKIIRKLMTGLGAAVLTATLAVGSIPAYAADGSLTLKPKVGDDIQSASQYNGTFKIYQVALYGDGPLTLTDAFKDCTVSLVLEEIQTADNTDIVTNFLKDHKSIKPVSTAKADQTVTLPEGLYYVCMGKQADGYTSFNPFLVTIPSVDPADPTGQARITDVTAYPKVEKVTPPPVTPPDGGGDEGGDDGGDDNPPTPPKPPVTPPKEEEGEDEETPETPETPEQPGEDIGNMGDDGMMTDAGAMTGDNSQMTTYAAVAGVAAVALIGWVVWKKRSKRQQ